MMSQLLLSRFKVCAVVMYGHTETDDEEGVEERSSKITWIRFWFLDRVTNRYRLCVNRGSRDIVREEVSGDFGVPDKNEIERRVVDI